MIIDIRVVFSCESLTLHKTTRLSLCRMICWRCYTLNIGIQRLTNWLTDWLSTWSLRRSSSTINDNSNNNSTLLSISAVAQTPQSDYLSVAIRHSLHNWAPTCLNEPTSPKAIFGFTLDWNCWIVRCFTRWPNIDARLRVNDDRVGDQADWLLYLMTIILNISL